MWLWIIGYHSDLGSLKCCLYGQNSNIKTILVHNKAIDRAQSA